MNAANFSNVKKEDTFEIVISIALNSAILATLICAALRIAGVH